jgi:hypothetical protein
MTTMKKLLLGMMLAAIPLVGCGAGDDSQIAVTADGLRMSIDQVSAPGEAPPTGDIANMSVEPNNDVSAMAGTCWVVLDYCRHPQTGIPHCTATNCTFAEAKKNCEALIRKTC